MVRSFLFCGLVVLLTSPASGQPGKRDHTITVADYFTQANLLESALSPDGKYIAYTEARWQQSTNDRKTDLWIVSTQTGKTQRLTFDRAGYNSPKWSPDSAWIYISSRRKRGEKQPPYDGTTQIWRISPQGGELFAVTRLEGGVLGYDLGPEGKTLYYQTEVEKIDDQWKHLRQQFKSINYGHGIVKVSQLWKLDLETWRSELVVDDNRVIKEFSLSPDGRHIAMITAPDDTVVSFEGRSRVDVYSASSKKVHTLDDTTWRGKAPSPYGWLAHLAWSGDGKSLAFNVIFDAYPAEIIVAEGGGDKWRIWPLQRPPGVSIRGYGSPIHWRGVAELCFLGEEKARVRVWSVKDVRVGKQGEAEVLTPGDVVVEDFSVAPSREQIAAVMNGQTHFPDLYLIDKIKPARRLTDINPQIARWKLPVLSVVSWKGANGDMVEGILELPPDYQPGQKLPLIVQLHGGPTTATRYQLQFWIYGRTLLASRGYALLCPNYRGSTGYGDKFLTDLVGRENDIEVTDILKGVEAMVERGIADPDRLGVMGWSNGGYLTNCLITHTTQFKAASSGAGIVDTVMEWGANDEPAYAISFKKGFPWSQPDIYRKTSPTYALDKIRTPTLIHVGANDERCPPGHSRMLYRALKDYVKVPTELLVYPGEAHGLMKYNSRQAKMEWDIAWFDRYLLGKDSNK